MKLERPSHALTVISTNFTHFENGEWNAARTYYVHNGEFQAAPVCLIDLKDGVRRTLADSSAHNIGAKFYRESAPLIRFERALD